MWWIVVAALYLLACLMACDPRVIFRRDDRP